MELDWEGPSLAPPPGVEPNFEHPPNQNILSIAVVTTSLVISTICVALRLYSRVFKVRQVAVQDHLMVAGFGTFASYSGLTYWRTNFVGAFVHLWDIQLKNLGPLRYEAQVAVNLYFATLGLTKVAILKEWLDIFVPPGTRNSFFWSAWTLIIFNTAYYTSGIISLNLACIPIQAVWDITIKGKCINLKLLEASGGLLNLISDLTILVFPQRAIWRLHTSRQKKLGVSCLFAIVAFAIAAAAFRFYASVKFVGSEDETFALAAVSLWVIAEMTSAFIVLCAPALPMAIHGDGVATRLVASLRSWAMLSRGRSGTNRSSSWPPGSILPVAKNPQQGRRPETDGLSTDELPLAQFRTDGVARGSGNNMASNRILRVDNFTFVEGLDANSDLQAKQWRDQHPWMARELP